MQMIDKDKFILSIMDAALSSIDEDTILDLADSSTVDAVPVVRCKDCKYFGRDMGNGKHSCNNFEMPYCTENDYCSHAKRNIKNGGQERMREILFRGRGDKKYNDGSQSFETYTVLYAELERDD